MRNNDLECDLDQIEKEDAVARHLRIRVARPAEAEAAINAEADKAGAAGNSDLMAKLKAAATNEKIQGAFMDVKNNGVSAAMKYKDDAERVAASQ